MHINFLDKQMPTRWNFCLDQNEDQTESAAPSSSAGDLIGKTTQMFYI